MDSEAITQACAALGLEVSSAGEPDAIRHAWLDKIKKHDLRGPCFHGGYLHIQQAYHDLRAHAQAQDAFPLAPNVDWLSVYLEESSEAAEEAVQHVLAGMHDGVPVSAQDVSRVVGLAYGILAPEIAAAPNYISHSRLAHAPTFAAVGSMLRTMLEWPEFAEMRCLLSDSLIRPEQEFLEIPQRIERAADKFGFRWRCGSWSSKGAMVWGSCKRASKRERDEWVGGAAPEWIITLNVGVWLLLGSFEQGRERLLHHELCHAYWDEEKARAKTIGHGIEENVETLARFGPLGFQQGAAVLMGYGHKETPKLIEAAGWDAKGQGLLFEPTLDQ